MNPTAKPPPNFSAFEIAMMSKALQLAEQGKFNCKPNPLVGCVITKDGAMVGQGWHQQFGGPHAEVNALAEAQADARGSCCFVTLEPCAHQGKTGPCASALIKAGVKKVIAAMTDPNPKVSGKGFKMLEEAGIEVQVGLLEEQARQLNRGFISRFQRGRPFVTCKLAMSLDGRTAMADGSSQWITGPAARADVQQLRARQDAIITGSGTVNVDNPSLTVRSADLTNQLQPQLAKAISKGFQQPARVILDSQQSCSLEAKVFNSDSQVVWVTDQAKVDLAKHIEQWSDAQNLPGLLSQLSEELACNNVLIEAGAKLAGSFLAAQLIDELIVYQAPKLMGNKAKGLFELAVDSMSQVVNLQIKETRVIGNDLRHTIEVVY